MLAMALLKFSSNESRLLTETYRGSAQARPKQALHDTSIKFDRIFGFDHI